MFRAQDLGQLVHLFAPARARAFSGAEAICLQRRLVRLRHAATQMCDILKKKTEILHYRARARGSPERQHHIAARHERGFFLLQDELEVGADELIVAIKFAEI